MSIEPGWYAARLIFRRGEAAEWIYDERILLVRALDLDDAISRAEQIARGYERDCGWLYCDYVDAFETKLSEIADGAFVYSLRRDSELDLSEYITRFFDTGKEHAGHSNGSYSTTYLTDVVYGIEPMSRTLARRIGALVADGGVHHADLIERLTGVKLGNVEAYQLAAALHESAMRFLRDGAGK